jgi:hypothetical protein
LISAVPIEAVSGGTLETKGVYERPESPWRIHVYRLGS